ncbi:MAG: dihydroorotate dehydrogenase electron transfer subunit [Planctomycetaceae bacterium]
MQTSTTDHNHQPCGIDPYGGMNPRAIHKTAVVVSHEPMALNTFRLRMNCPELAKQILPGQFFMVRMPGLSDPLLGRPFALFNVYRDAEGAPSDVDFGYVVIGKMTQLLSTCRPGDKLEIWGPLGNGFPLPDNRPLLLVAGGIGHTPFLAVAREALRLQSYGDPVRAVKATPSGVSLCYGVRSSGYLAGLEDFTLPGLDLRIATDDGSRGHKGFVTELLDRTLDEMPAKPVVYCCGPEPMMHVVSRLTASRETPCWLSLETPMACGFGACFSCVVRVRMEGDDWDYRRVCVEGPVFPAERLVW